MYIYNSVFAAILLYIDEAIKSQKYIVFTNNLYSWITSD